jgi:drug/metabolite transporter (DMT)-like permease
MAKYLGAFYVMSSGLCYGLIGYFGVNLMNAGLSVYNMLFWRFLLSAIFTSIIFIKQLSTLLHYKIATCKALLYGLLLYGPSSITYFISTKYIGSGISMVVFFAYPTIVILINYLFYKVKVTKVYYTAIPMIIIGMICLIDSYEIANDITGIFISILSAFFYAIYIIASKKSDFSIQISSISVSVGCAIISLFAAIMDHSLFIPNTFLLWTDIIAISTICTAIPILLLLQGLKYMSSEKASILSVLEPIFVVIFGNILLGEKISIIQIIGILIIILGAIIVLLYGNKKEEALKNLILDSDFDILGLPSNDSND